MFLFPVRRLALPLTCRPNLYDAQHCFSLKFVAASNKPNTYNIYFFKHGGPIVLVAQDPSLI
ncbi:hypothetical protein Hanom_Chr08g00702701 [Helianthus anomalus]